MKIKRIQIFYRGEIRNLTRKEMIELLDNDVMVGETIEITGLDY